MSHVTAAEGLLFQSETTRVVDVAASAVIALRQLIGSWFLSFSIGANDWCCPWLGILEFWEIFFWGRRDGGIIHSLWPSRSALI